MMPVRLALASGLLLALLCMGIPMRQEELQAQEVAAANKAPMPQLVGTANCVGCHSGPNTPAYLEYQKTKQTDFVLLSEHTIWKASDLHAKAWENIVPDAKAGPNGQGNLAWRMQQVLRQNPARGKDYQVHQAAECLTCHAVDRQPGEVQIDQQYPDRFVTNYGVSCEACHGFADDWLGEHFKLSWRNETPAAKAKRGLNDLRDPAIRAKNCVSCHVGDQSMGRYVSHEIYAAGHPPLPPFELTRYGEDQPRHYHATATNSVLADYAKQDADSAWKRFHYRQPSTEKAECRELLSGILQSLRAEIELLHREASTLQPGQLFDFAHFDCAACHHDLKYPSERQLRVTGTPGRPKLKSQFELAPLLMQLLPNQVFQTNQAEDISKSFLQLKQSFDRSVFGKPAEVQKLAGGLVQQLDQLQGQLNGVIIPPEHAIVMRKVLQQEVARRAQPKEGLAEYLDYDLAQLLVWADTALAADPANLKRFEPLMRAKLRPLAPESVESRLDADLKKQYRFLNQDFFALWGKR